MRNQRGLSLIELIIAAGLGCVVLLGMGFVLVQTAEVQNRTYSLTQIDEFRMNIIAVLANDLALQRTVEANSSIGAYSSGRMECLRAVTACVDGGTEIRDQTFTLVDANGVVVVDGASATSGFNAKGAPCLDFNDTTGSDSCPFRYDLTWTAICNPGNCINPLIEFKVRLRYKPATAKMAINTESRSIERYRRILPASFKWYATGWSDCACPGGTQTQSVACRFANGATVNDLLCREMKPPVSRTCICPAPCLATTIANCQLAAVAHGGTSGTCTGGMTGACSYRCNAGTWTSISNVCTAPPVPCAATTIGFCQLPASPGGTTAGACDSKSSGSCSFTCSGGNWVPGTNACTPVCNAIFTTGKYCGPFGGPGAGYSSCTGSVPCSAGPQAYNHTSYRGGVTLCSGLNARRTNVFCDNMPR